MQGNIDGTTSADDNPLHDPAHIMGHPRSKKNNFASNGVESFEDSALLFY